MNVFILLVGAPGSGKSTWTEKNGLKDFAISADTIRLMYSAPIVDKDGSLGISNKHDKKVWVTLWSIVKERMNTGSLIVLDTCGLSTNTLGDVKGLCRKFSYKLVIKKFDDSKDLDLLIQRNCCREEQKRVPLEVIKIFHKRYMDFDFSKYETIDNWNWLSHKGETIKGDNYERVFVLGDIHGCINTLENFFEIYKPSEKDIIIFTGDFVDRGIHNAKTVLKLMSLENAVFVKGNHDRWLCYYANKNTDFIGNEEFLEKTSKELSNIPKEDLQAFCEKFQNSVVMHKEGNIFVITHGGITSWERARYMSSALFINGVGRYPDVYEVDKLFNENSIKSGIPIYSIHGHRNPERKETNYYERVFNLEGRIEYGEELRFLIIDSSGIQIKSIATHKDDISDTKETHEE